MKHKDFYFNIIISLFMSMVLIFTVGCEKNPIIEDIYEINKEKDMQNLINARRYMDENKGNINDRYRQTFHAVSPIGWMNDPNGFSYAFNNYHLFFQYNPYDIKWGPMHWGHYITKDFIKWELQPIALAPDEDYDINFGCFSGSAINYNNELFLVYTGVAKGVQTQCLARSEDGVNFYKILKNPIINTTQIPKGNSILDFRDPKIVKYGEKFYCFIGSKTNSNIGQILLYKSNNLIDWQYVGVVVQSSIVSKGIFECPDFFTQNGNDVIIASPQFYPKQDTKFENVHSVVYSVGKMNFKTGEFSGTEFDEIDSGFDFYAAQTLLSADERIIMTAWMQMWDRTMPTAIDGYTGSMILSREITFENNKIIQKPVREIENYRKNKIEYSNIDIDGEKELSDIKGKTIELNFEIDMKESSIAGVKLFCGNGCETLIYYDKQKKCVVFDRNKSGFEIKSSAAKESDASIRYCKTDLINNKIKFRIFLDKSSVELFINDGQNTMTGCVYPNEENEDIKFFSDADSTIVNISKYDILV
jgi:beta-fructofuranosidase